MPVTIQLVIAGLAFAGYLGIGLMVIVLMDARPPFLAHTARVRERDVVKLWLVWPLFVLWLLWKAWRRG